MYILDGKMHASCIVMHHHNQVARNAADRGIGGHWAAARPSGVKSVGVRAPETKLLAANEPRCVRVFDDAKLPVFFVWSTTHNEY